MVNKIRRGVVYHSVERRQQLQNFEELAAGHAATAAAAAAVVLLQYGY
jgi:hypothetical protein